MIFEVFLGIQLVPAAAEGQRRSAAHHPADHQYQADAERGNEQERQQAAADGLGDGFFLGALKAGSDGFAQQIVQPPVLFETNARRAEGDGLRMFPNDVAAGSTVGRDDFAADVAAVDLDLLQRDAVAVPAGAEDLKEFAVFEGDVPGFPIAEPHQQQKGGRDEQRRSGMSHTPGSARLFAFFLHGRLLLLYRIVDGELHGSPFTVG